MHKLNQLKIYSWLLYISGILLLATHFVNEIEWKLS